MTAGRIGLVTLVEQSREPTAETAGARFLLATHALTASGVLRSWRTTSLARLI